MKSVSRPAIVAATALALSTIGLFAARQERLASERDWDNYMLAEQRWSTATTLIAAQDPFGRAEAVLHIRGAFIAIAAALEEPIPNTVAALLDGEVHLTALAGDLVSGSYDSYNTLKIELDQMQGRVLSGIQGTNGARLGMVGWTFIESAMFLLTVICALLLNLVNSRTEDPQ